MAVATVCLCLPLGAEESLDAPNLGLVHDTARHVIRPVLGVPGAATLGDAIALPFAVEKAAIGMDSSYALARAPESAELYLIRRRPEGYTADVLAGALENADRLVLSNGGTSAAVYRKEDNRLQIWNGLPDEPLLARELELTPFGAEPAAIAVSGDGRTLLAAFHTEETAPVWVFRTDTDAKLAITARNVTNLGFVRDSEEALVVDQGAQTVYLLNADNASTVLAGPDDGIEAPIDAKVTADRKFLYIAGAGSSSVVIVNLEDRSRRDLSCSCVPSGLTRMLDRAVFRLNDVSEGPMWLLDAAPIEPRLVFVPPAPIE